MSNYKVGTLNLTMYASYLVLALQIYIITRYGYVNSIPKLII